MAMFATGCAGDVVNRALRFGLGDPISDADRRVFSDDRWVKVGRIALHPHDHSTGLSLTAYVLGDGGETYLIANITYWYSSFYSHNPDRYPPEGKFSQAFYGAIRHLEQAVAGAEDADRKRKLAEMEKRQEEEKAIAAKFEALL